MTNPVVSDLLGRSNRLGADPRNTNYAGGNTSAKGTETDPVTGQPVELLWVKGSGGDLGTLTEAGPRRAAAGPAARARRRLPGRRPRGRDGRRLRLLPARPRRRRAVDRHRHARPRRRRRTSTTCTPTPASRWPPPPTARRSPGVLRRPRRLGAVAPARASSWAWTSPRSRRRTRRPSAASSAATASPPGATTSEQCEANSPGDHPDGGALPRRARHGRSRSGRRCPATRRCRRRERRQQGRRARPGDPRPRVAPTGRRSGTSPTPTSSWTSSASAEHPRLAALGTSCPDHFLRTKVRPLVVDLPADRAGRGRRRAAEGAARGVPRRVRRLLRAARDPGQPGRCAARTRRSCWCPASACSASAPTSRPPAWPASSTSTRST